MPQGKRWRLDTPFTPAIKQYLNFRKASGDDPRTLDEYRSLLYRIAAAYPEMGVELLNGKEGADRIIIFALHEWPDAQPNTLRKYMSMIATAADRFALQGDIGISPRPWLPKPKRAKQLKPAFPVYLYERILNLCTTQSDRLAVMLMGHVGLRTHELRAIQFRHIQPREGIVYLPKAKYGKTGPQEMGYEVVRLQAERAIAERRPEPDEYLIFPYAPMNTGPHKGKKFPRMKSPLSKGAHDNWWHRLIDAADIPRGDWTMHALRRLAGCRFWEAHKDAVSTARFMRHEKVDTVFEYYVALSDDAYREALRRASAAHPPISGNTA